MVLMFKGLAPQKARKGSAKRVPWNLFAFVQKQTNRK
jgi:hypothetical protein